MSPTPRRRTGQTAQAKQRPGEPRPYRSAKMRRRAEEISAQNERDLDAYVTRVVEDYDIERWILQRRIEEIDNTVYRVLTIWAR